MTSFHELDRASDRPRNFGTIEARIEYRNAVLQQRVDSSHLTLEIRRCECQCPALKLSRLRGNVSDLFSDVVHAFLNRVIFFSLVVADRFTLRISAQFFQDVRDLTVDCVRLLRDTVRSSV